jgi:hypothetical protein
MSRRCVLVPTGPAPGVAAVESMPMSRMPSVGRWRSGGTAARMPGRGASVATPMPDRSIASATKL